MMCLTLEQARSIHQCVEHSYQSCDVVTKNIPILQIWKVSPEFKTLV